MIMELTPTEIKKRITPAMVAVACLYLEKKLYADTIRPIIQEQQLKIIQENGFCYDADFADENAGKPITDVKYAWMMNESDFLKYAAESQKMYTRLGFKVEKDCCPLLIANHEVLKAKQNLVEVCQPIMMGMTWDLLSRKLDLMEQAIDLLVKILIP